MHTLSRPLSSSPRFQGNCKPNALSILQTGMQDIRRTQGKEPALTATTAKTGLQWAGLSLKLIGKGIAKGFTACLGK